MLAIERIMGVFFEKRRTPFVVPVLSYLLFFVVTGGAFLLWNIPIISVPVNITAIFVITLNYESSLKKKLAATIGSYTLFIFADIVAGLSSGFYQIDPLDVLGFENTFGFIITGTMSYMLALLLRKFKNIRKNTIDSSMFLVIYSAIIFSTLILLLFISTYLPMNMSIVATIIILGINVFIFYLHDNLSVMHEDKLKSALHAQEKEYYFTQCQLMQESVEQMKLYRHDVKFHLATLNDFAIKDNADSVIKYLNSLLDNIGKKEVYSDTGNIAFDSIINFKLKTAAEDNIKVDINVLIPPILNIEVADIVTILGNLLDNAIDGVAKIKDKTIKLNIEAGKGNLFIKTDNTFDGLVKYAKGKDGTAEAITTRKSGDNHGYGLKNIRKAVEKYNGRVDISYEDNVFSVAILLYVDEM